MRWLRKGAFAPPFQLTNRVILIHAKKYTAMQPDLISVSIKGTQVYRAVLYWDTPKFTILLISFIQ
jgi:hypothetical protein